MEIGRQLFVLPREIWRSLSKQEVLKTTEAMIELDIFKPPYKEFDIETSCSQMEIHSWLHGWEEVIPIGPHTEIANDTQKMAFRYVFNDDLEEYKCFLRTANNKNCYDLNGEEIQRFYKYYSNNGDIGADEVKSQLLSMQYAFYYILITCLCAKNAVKDTVEFKIHGAKSRKKPKYYRYVTTIKLGKITETYKSNNSIGLTVRPHLRRGHIRLQHFGVGNKEIKKIFIQPVFVNADEGWIANERKAYKVTV